MKEALVVLWEWLTAPDFLNLLDILSFFVSVATLITMLFFKRRVRIEFDKQAFRKNKVRLQRDFSAMHDSLQDGLYTKHFLETIDSALDEIIVAYPFLPALIKVKIRYAGIYIRYKCIPDSEKNDTSRAHKLRKMLRRIEIKIRKED